LRYANVIELSHPIKPGAAGRRFEIRQVGAETVAPVQRKADEWYIMHEVEMVNHLGTHIEVPYHLIRSGADLAAFPVERTFGPTRILDITRPEPGHSVTKREIQDAARRAGGIDAGEIVFVRTGWSDAWGTEQYLESPWFQAEGLDWLIRQGMVLFGVECAGVEELTSTTHESHLALFEHNVPLIENLTNMTALGYRKRVTTMSTPLAIEGLEAFPVRVIAY
jgi:arylformamidase